MRICWKSLRLGRICRLGPILKLADCRPWLWIRSMRVTSRDGVWGILARGSVFCPRGPSLLFGAGHSSMMSCFQSTGGSSTSKGSRGNFRWEKKMGSSTTVWIWMRSGVQDCQKKLSNGTLTESMLLANNNSTLWPCRNWKSCISSTAMKRFRWAHMANKTKCTCWRNGRFLEEKAATNISLKITLSAVWPKPRRKWSRNTTDKDCYWSIDNFIGFFLEI